MSELGNTRRTVEHALASWRRAENTAKDAYLKHDGTLSDWRFMAGVVSGLEIALKAFPPVKTRGTRR